MNHMTFKDKEGFDINVLAFDGESNFAILERTSTGSPTPYVVVKGLDTAKETTLPSVEDILCNVEDMVDEDGKYTNAWNITDNYLSDPDVSI